MTKGEALAEATGEAERLILQHLLDYRAIVPNSTRLVIAQKLLAMNLFGLPVVRPMETEASKLIKEQEAEIQQLRADLEWARRGLEEAKRELEALYKWQLTGEETRDESDHHGG